MDLRELLCSLERVYDKIRVNIEKYDFVYN